METPLPLSPQHFSPSHYGSAVLPYFCTFCVTISGRNLPNVLYGVQQSLKTISLTPTYYLLWGLWLDSVHTTFLPAIHVRKDKSDNINTLTSSLPP